MATKKTEVAVKAETPVMMFSQETPEWAKDGSRGNENVGAKDLVLPRLEIIQGQSPILDTNPDAKEGMFFNSATQDLMEGPVFIIPVYYRMEYLIWKDQDSGGGFFGAFETQKEAENRLQEVVSDGEEPSELEIVDTPVHYCLRVREDMSTEQIVISMPKSKTKVSRKWNATIQIVGGDRFARVYQVSTFKDKNKQGKGFQNLVIQPAGFASKALFDAAAKVYETFRTEGVKADHASAGSGDERPSDDLRGDI